MKLSDFIKNLQECAYGKDPDVTICGTDEYAENIRIGEHIDIVPLATPEHLEYTRHLERQIEFYNKMSFWGKFLQGFKVYIN